MPLTWDELLRVALRQVEDARQRLASPRFRFEARRKAFHVAGAVVAVPALLLLPFLWALALAATVLVVIVVAHVVAERRAARKASLGAVEALTDPVGEAIRTTRRPGETFPWAPVSFTLALIAVGAVVEFARLPLAYAFAAFGILGFGDAASALVGVAFGRRKLAWNRGKSWEGLLAGLVVGYLAAVVLGAVWYAFHRLPFPLELLGVFAAGAIVGAMIETLPRVQDNWAVPLGSLAVMVGLAYVVGAL